MSKKSKYERREGNREIRRQLDKMQPEQKSGIIVPEKEPEDPNETMEFDFGDVVAEAEAMVDNEDDPSDIFWGGE